MAIKYKKGVSKQLLELCAGSTVVRTGMAQVDSKQSEVFICDKALNRLDGTKDGGKEWKKK